MVRKVKPSHIFRCFFSSQRLKGDESLDNCPITILDLGTGMLLNPFCRGLSMTVPSLIIVFSPLNWSTTSDATNQAPKISKSSPVVLINFDMISMFMLYI